MQDDLLFLIEIIPRVIQDPFLFKQDPDAHILNFGYSAVEKFLNPNPQTVSSSSLGFFTQSDDTSGVNPEPPQDESDSQNSPDERQSNLDTKLDSSQF